MPEVSPKVQQINRLNDAMAAVGNAWALPDPGATHYAIIRAVVRATVPGNQRTTNLEPLMETAIKAAVRTIRRKTGR